MKKGVNRRGKKGSKNLNKKVEIDLLTIAIVIVTIGVIAASGYYFFIMDKLPKKNKSQDQNKNLPGGTQNTQTTITTNSGNTQEKEDFEEVDNSFFANNPFAYSTTDRLNIREFPGRGAKVIKQVNEGDFIGTHTGKSTDVNFPAPGSRWAKIMDNEGQILWVWSGGIKSETNKRLDGIFDGILIA